VRIVSLLLLVLALGCASKQPPKPATPARVPAWPSITEGMSHQQVESAMKSNYPPFSQLSKVTHDYETITTYGASGDMSMSISVDEHAGVVIKAMRNPEPMGNP